MQRDLPSYLELRLRRRYEKRDERFGQPLSSVIVWPAEVLVDGVSRLKPTHARHMSAAQGLMALGAVTFHLNRVVEKLGASSKSQAISWALKQGLVRLNIDTALVGNVDEGDQ